MDKEKILEASRAEKSDERVLQVNQQSGAIAMWVGALACMLIVGFSYMVDKKNASPWVIYCCMLTTNSIIQYVKLKKKVHLVVSILGSVLTVFWLTIYLIDVFGG